MVVLQEALESKTILIVDDQRNNLQLLSEYLENANYETSIANNGVKAIEIAKALQPDLILLDIMMPVMDGFAVCSHLKNEPNTKDIPIIFMTALAQTKNKIKGLELGAADYITKPFEEKELLARIKTHLTLKHLYQTSLQDARRSLILETGDRIRQSLDLEVIFATATTEIRNLLNCDVVSIVSLNQQKTVIEAYAAVEKDNIESHLSIAYQDLCPSQDLYNAYLQNQIEIDSQSRLIAPILITNTHRESSFVSPTEKQSDNTLYGWLIAGGDSNHRHWRTSEINLVKEILAHLAMGIEQGLLHQKLSELALLDSLTRIYNRRFFDLQLEREWGKLRRTPALLSLIMCDLDYFKVYNDAYGHQQGDKCLQQVSKAILSALRRSGDILARYGGEEFAIILPHTSQEGASKVGENIRKAIKKLEIPHQNSLVDSVVTASIGVATTVPNSAEQPQLLIEAADLALYQAKERGRDCIAVYPGSIVHAKNRDDLRIRWIKRLRLALEKNLFSLYAQSITPLKKSDQRKSFEILLRLTDRADKVILPGVFLDIAERNSLMSDIDTWVVNSLFETLEKCDRGCPKGLTPCRGALKDSQGRSPKDSAYPGSNRATWENYCFSVNLSGESLNNESFLQFLKERLAKSLLPPSLFCFEITESIAVSNLERVIEFINSLKKIGCRFALDDFGKGISSLSYLKSLPVDYLKIDGCFIRELNIDRTSKIMVEAIRHIAEGIGIETVAEFVENEHILSSVQDLNVDYAQGFHLSRPKALLEIINGV